MSDQTNEDRDREIKLLRNQVALLISKNLDLQRQLNDLQRAKTDTPIESLAASVVNSIQAAEGALADETVEGRRFVVSQFETTFKGVILPQEGSLALRLPLPEYGVVPGHLGSVRMAFVHVPAPIATPPESELAPSTPGKPGPPESIPSDPVSILRNRLALLLERGQATLVSWAGGPGVTLRPKVVDQLTRLLATRDQWEGTAFLKDLQSLAESLSNHANAVARGRLNDTTRAYRTAAAALVDAVTPLATAGSASPADLEALTAALEQVVKQQEGIKIQ